MADKLKMTLHSGDAATFLQLSGTIDEDSAFETLNERIPPGTLFIDLAGVRRINSCGVRDWMVWLGELRKHDVDIVLAGCSPPIVAQINLIDDFVRGGVVLSLRAPYTCPDCGAEMTVLLDAVALGGHPQVPTQPCKSCGGTMELDEVPEIYFSFLAAQEKVATPARIDALRTMARHAPNVRAGHVDP